MLKQTMAGQLGLMPYLERGAAHLTCWCWRKPTGRRSNPAATRR